MAGHGVSSDAAGPDRPRRYINRPFERVKLAGRRRHVAQHGADQRADLADVVVDARLVASDRFAIDQEEVFSGKVRPKMSISMLRNLPDTMPGMPGLGCSE